MTPEQRTRIEVCGYRIVEIEGAAPGCRHEPDHPSGQPEILVPAGATPESVDLAAAHVEALKAGTSPPGPEVFCEAVAKAMGNTQKEAQTTADQMAADAGISPADIASLRVEHGTVWRSVVAAAEQAAEATGQGVAMVLARARQRNIGLVGQVDEPTEI